MSCYACLRVELPPAFAPSSGPIHVQLRKIVETYLETRWSWPRRFSPIAELAFLLSDPGAAELPLDELVDLADQLQHHLFGPSSAPEGEVTLLVFEGPASAVRAFARLGADEVAAAIADQRLLPPGGRLMRLRPASGPTVETLADSAPEPTGGPPPRAVHPSHRMRPGVLGFYLLSRQVFIADVLALAPADSAHCFNVVGDEGQLPGDEEAFDEQCFRAAPEVLSHKAGGLPLGVPVAYSHFVRQSQAQRFGEMLALLPKPLRDQLNASIYGVPRHLPYGVGALHPLLATHFSTINLIVSDPGFEVEHLAARSVAGVVLRLCDHDPHARQAAMRVFASRHDAYRRRGVHAALANLRTRAELELAAHLDLQIVSGPAVCAFTDEPLGGKAVPLSELPVSGTRGGA
jgi:hypothetical protein